MEENSLSATSSPPEQQQPLLRPPVGGAQPPPARSNRVATLLGRAAGRRSGPSALVRETAAMQLEERRADWAYSRPVVALDISWNLAFAVVSALMLGVTLSERPNVPLRVWVAGYAVQCVVHVVLVWSEYRRRRMVERREGGDGEAGRRDSDVIDSEEEGDDGGIWMNRRSR